MWNLRKDPSIMETNFDVKHLQTTINILCTFLLQMMNINLKCGYWLAREGETHLEKTKCSQKDIPLANENGCCGCASLFLV